jgi:hypothetical protein
MMLRIAWRSLMTRPVRAAVLAAGFGFGIAVMAELLGVGEVILEQAHAPALSGGGDLLVYGPYGTVPSARFIMTSVLGTSDLAGRVATVSPARQSRLFLTTPAGSIPLVAKGGIPSLERALGDPEVSTIASWVDAPGDERWARPDPSGVLRAMDRFHRIPEIPAERPSTQSFSRSSWAEWLYFNGRTRDGRLRIYLTFLVGPHSEVAGKRRAEVHLQLERDGRSRNFTAAADVDETALLANAPDLEIAGNRVQLQGLSYRMTLALSAAEPRSRSERAEGEIVLDAAPGRSLPPASVQGAGGWVTGYVVPALAGTMRGSLRVQGETVTFDGATGYHDHNWGFWQGVSWQWGQVAHENLSIVYGRIFPPADVADPTRAPAFLTALGPDGPLGFSTNVTIDDSTTGVVDVRATSTTLDLHLALSVNETVRTAMSMTAPAVGEPLNFVQLGGVFRVTGTVAGRPVDFSARGSAETFKPK